MMGRTVVKTGLFSRMGDLDTGGMEKNYKGLAIHALNGLHEFVGDKVKELFFDSANLLDLAAGSGALSLRLQDMGFKITAYDYEENNFRLKQSIKFNQVDLNNDFSKISDCLYDGVIAVEIIEHLENPRHLIREIYDSLVPGGKVLITTPNIDNPVSLAFYVRFGWFQWFSDENYNNEGHITPVSQHWMNKFLLEAGFVDVDFVSYGDPFRVLVGWPKMKYFARLLSFLTSIDKSKQGEIMVVSARKPN
ncbi:class I SAM-dependent methyltransferase [Methylomonas sp. SURF-2]|uniref:Class I SAM-dependent methyltransferase n=1 Tax=Methylomonas subterranea TaxID=2952225 RepID=A0ABT1TEB2_9GAMM|nr:class I SAM-dependent methyltransferase [Methylomonas sp. SURF-2]MCQ8103099.1 class I SAM-dependent methyltransferase [Methylomonas sp. SURF-2]